MTPSPSSPRAGRGRPTVVDRTSIAAAVLEIGFVGLTFAAVAERLGIGQATLYRHAANRDELVGLGLDLALQRFVWPDLDGSWREVLESWAVASWRAWEKHPGAVLEAARGVCTDSIARLADTVATALVERGFSARDAVLAVDLVFDLALDNRRGVEAFAAPASTDDVRAGMEHRWRDEMDAPVHTREVRAEMVRAIRMEPFDWFRTKLSVVLDGIEHSLASKGTR